MITTLLHNLDPVWESGIQRSSFFTNHDFFSEIDKPILYLLIWTYMELHCPILSNRKWPVAPIEACSSLLLWPSLPSQPGQHFLVQQYVSIRQLWILNSGKHSWAYNSIDLSDANLSICALMLTAHTKILQGTTCPAYNIVQQRPPGNPEMKSANSFYQNGNRRNLQAGPGHFVPAGHIAMKLSCWWFGNSPNHRGHATRPYIAYCIYL